MASEISIRVRATNEASAALRDAARDAGLLDASVDDLQGTMATLGEKSEKVKQDIGQFDEVVKKHRDSMRELATSYANANNEADKLNIAGQISKIQKELDQQLRVRKIKVEELVEIENTHGIAERLMASLNHDIEEEARRAGGGAGDDIVDGIGRDVDSSKGRLAGIGTKLGAFFGEHLGVTAGATAAPILVSSLGSLISAGAGALGIGAGVMLAIKSDTEIQNAGKQLGKDLFGQLTQSAHTAFAEPIKRELDVLGNYGDQIADQWGDAFEDLAPSLEPFVTSLANTITKFSGALADIAGDSGPALAALADGFDVIGDSIIGLLENITEESGENAGALEMLTVSIAGLIDGVSAAVSVLQVFLVPFQAIYGVSKAAGEGIGWVAKQFGAGSDAMHGFRAVTVDTTEAMGGATSAAKEETDALKGLADQLKAQTDPAFALIDAQKQLRDANKAYSKAVKDNGKDSSEAKDALLDLAKAAISVEAAAEKASGTFDGSVSPALRDTLKAAGLTDAKIDGVAKAFRGAKKAGDDFAGKYTASVQERGAAAAKAAIASAAAEARRYQGQYIAALKVKVSRIDAGFDGPQAKATGGVIGTAATGATSSGLTWVGEQGPELVSLQPGTRVMSAVDSARGQGNTPMSQITEMFRQDRGLNNRNRFNKPTSGGPPSIIHVHIGGHKLAEITVPAIQEFVSTRAGGDVNVLSGRN